MVAEGKLGDKTKGGFYKKVADGLETLDPATGQYRPQQKPKIPVVKALKDVEDLGERLRTLAATDDKYGRFAFVVTARTFAYAARRLGEIADDVTQIDRAMRWGFNWEKGPFESWDAMGFAETAKKIAAAGITLPAWVSKMVEAGIPGFYRNDGAEFWDPFKGEWKRTSQSPRVLRLPKRTDAKKVVEHNDSATLFDIGDGVFCVEFHSKMNSVDPDNTAMLVKGVERAEHEGAGLVIANEATDAFSAGANLFLVLMTANQAAENPALWKDLEQQVREFQDANQRLKFANVPVVAAPFGLTLGGGCEIALGAQAIRAHAELYMGLVEVGVGLIPGGGGTKEVLWRLTSGVRDGDDLFPAIQRAFETIAMAKVSTSAAEARELGFLTASDRVTFNRDQLVHDAKQTVLALNLQGFRPTRPRTFRVGGTAAFANLQAGLWSMVESHQISEHDRKIATKLASVLTGGNVPANSRVSEQYLLDLEREAFMSLVGEERTKERMAAMLTTGKPLRN
jgi:3-hydroxyacyl-CoA dehydrogenase